MWRSPPRAPGSATWRSRSARRFWCAATRGCVPTPAGRTLLQHARGTPGPGRAPARGPGLVYAGGLAGQIRILSNTNALTEFLPEALSAFLASHAQVSIDLEERLSGRDRGPDRGGRRRYRHRGRHRRYGRASTTYPFRSDRFVVVVAERASARGGRARSRSRRSSGHDFVGLDRASALQRFLADKASRIGLPIRLRVQLRSFDAVCRMVEAGVGLGIVPETTARAGRPHHGDHPGRTEGFLGAARTHDLRSRPRQPGAVGAAACRAPARRSALGSQRSRVTRIQVQPRERLRASAQPSPGQQRPVVQIQDHGGVVALPRLVRKGGAGWFFVATRRSRRAPTSSRPGNSARSSTWLQA